MAHNINRNIKTGQDAFFSVKEKAWHGLGKIVEQYPTAEEAIRFAGLNYEVVKRPLFTYDADNSSEETAPDGIQIPEIIVPNYFATVRKDTDQILGVVGSKYEVIQNATAFSFFDALVNDGSGAAMAAFTPIRIVCNNTLNMALRNNSNAVYIKHTANAEEKLREAARIIHISDVMTEKLTDMFNHWARVRITDAELKKLIRLAMSPNKEVFQAVVTSNDSYEFSRQFEDVCGQVFEYAMTNPSQTMETTAGTLFGAYNAISGYYQNVKDYKSADTKTNSILYGTAFERTKKAFELCEMANDFLN